MDDEDNREHLFGEEMVLDPLFLADSSRRAPSEPLDAVYPAQASSNNNKEVSSSRQYLRWRNPEQSQPTSSKHKLPFSKRVEGGLPTPTPTPTGPRTGPINLVLPDTFPLDYSPTVDDTYQDLIDERTDAPIVHRLFSSFLKVLEDRGTVPDPRELNALKIPGKRKTRKLPKRSRPPVLDKEPEALEMIYFAEVVQNQDPKPILDTICDNDTLSDLD